MPDNGKRQELVRGVVREMPLNGAAHGCVTSTILTALYESVDKQELGFVFPATGFILERDPDTVLAPDCAFVRAGRLSRPFPEGYIPFVPDLAVETISFADRPAEMEEKVNRWLAAGARLVWVLDPGPRTATVHRPGSGLRVLREGDSLDGEDVVPGFRIAVARLFDLGS